MPNNPYAECLKFETADRRDLRQRDEAISRANERYAAKRSERKHALSPEALAVIEMAELKAAAAAETEDRAAYDCQPPSMSAEPAAIGWTKVEELGADAQKAPAMTEDEMSRLTVKAEMKAARKAAKGG